MFAIYSSLCFLQVPLAILFSILFSNETYKTYVLLCSYFLGDNLILKNKTSKTPDEGVRKFNGIKPQQIKY